MANGNITVSYERRACYVRMANGDMRKAMFHRWTDDASVINAFLEGQASGQHWRVYGLVEYEDGTVRQVIPPSITFVDGGGFDEVAFPPAEGREEE